MRPSSRLIRFRQPGKPGTLETECAAKRSQHLRLIGSLTSRRASEAMAGGSCLPLER